MCKLSPVLRATFLMNNPVCLSYLFIKFANDVLDIALYNRDKFTFSVTLVSKEIVKTLVVD